MNIALLLALSLTTPLDTATFAGGCFWTMEHAYDDLPGVISATSGFMGGSTKNPSYMQVVEGNTGHLESVQVVYDPAKVSYETLLWTFWHNIDPFQADGQACDTGPNSTAFTVMSQRRSSPPARSIRPRSITRTTPKRIRFAMGCIAPAAAATGGCGRSGAMKQVGSVPHPPLNSGRRCIP